MVQSYGTLSNASGSIMGIPETKGSSGLCKLLLFAIGVLAIIALSSAITWYITKSALNGDSIIPSSPKKGDTGPSAAELRLPDSLRPTNYSLTMKTYLPGYVTFPTEKNLTFEGQVEIDIDVKVSVKKIVLNMVDLQIKKEKSSVTVNGVELGITSIITVEKLEKVNIQLDKAVNAGDKLLLKLQYVGDISDKLEGLYQTVYKDAEGNPKIAAVTQMEPTDARRMVPCFDEPDMKAPWTVTIIHPKGTQAISNGIESGTTSVDDDFLSTTFKTTPKMSSYLLALFISDFSYNEGTTKSGIRFRVWARKEEKESIEYALEAGIKCIEFYEELFGIPYPLEKQDMVALPDFSAGAMENWGLITYREVALLYNSKDYDLADKKYVSTVIAHELAHQWFGNLVTMKWWDNLWLNEGFATLIEYLGAETISNGTFQMKDAFLIDSFRSALNSDGKANSHPLSFRIDKSIEVNEAFTSITYDKGSSVLHMIRTLMGEDNFIKGVQVYLKRFSYSNAVANDLWNALDEVMPTEVLGPDGNRLNISDFAPQWTNQMGFPFMTVSKNGSDFVVRQKRYKEVESAKELDKYRNPSYKFKWDVPVWYQEEGGEKKLIWHPREASEIRIASEAKNLVVNADANAFMRMNYDKEGWKTLIETLKNNIEVYGYRTRHAIISDAFAMAKIERLGYDQLFSLIEALRNEQNYFAMSVVMSGARNIIGYYDNEPEGGIVREYFAEVFDSIRERTSIADIDKNNGLEEKFYDSRYAIEAVSLYSDLEDPTVKEELLTVYKEQFDLKCTNDSVASECGTIPSPLLSLVYCAGVGNLPGAMEKLLSLYKRETNQYEAKKLLSGLTCAPTPKQIRDLLTLALDRKTNTIRMQDASIVFSMASRAPVGKEIIFSFLLSRWDQIYESLSSSVSSLSRVVKACAAPIRTRRELDNLRSFYVTNKHAKELHAFTEAIEAAEARVEWIENHFEEVTDIAAKRLQAMNNL